MAPVLVALLSLALIVLWVIVVARDKAPHSERHATSYRDQKYENPDWVPGHSGV